MDHDPSSRGPTPLSPERRQFLEHLAGRSLAAIGLTAVAAAIVYEKPRLKSFLPDTTAYAQTTGAGKFTLRGTS